MSGIHREVPHIIKHTITHTNVSVLFIDNTIRDANACLCLVIYFNEKLVL